MTDYAAVRNLLVKAQSALDGGDVQSESISRAIDYLIEVVEDEEYRAPSAQAQIIPFPRKRVGARK